MSESFIKHFLAEPEVEKQYVVFQEYFLVSGIFFACRKTTDTTRNLTPRKRAI